MKKRKLGTIRFLNHRKELNLYIKMRAINNSRMGKRTIWNIRLAWYLWAYPAFCTEARFLATREKIRWCQKNFFSIKTRPSTWHSTILASSHIKGSKRDLVQRIIVSWEDRHCLSNQGQNCHLGQNKLWWKIQALETGHRLLKLGPRQIFPGKA
jgi:hypothetical protein